VGCRAVFAVPDETIQVETENSKQVMAYIENKMQNSKIKTFLFAEDGVTASVENYKTFSSVEDFQVHQEKISVYDNGASHYLLEYTKENFDNILEEYPELKSDLIVLSIENN
jgi:translation initiation factor IF-1